MRWRTLDVSLEQAITPTLLLFSNVFGFGLPAPASQQRQIGEAINVYLERLHCR
jgi:hypothetical protein